MTKSELNNVLKAYAAFLEDGSGKRADLRFADLPGADLWCAVVPEKRLAQAEAEAEAQAEAECLK